MPHKLPTELPVGDALVPLKVTRRKGQKRMVLRYHPLKRQLSLSLPARCSVRQVIGFLDEREGWIEEMVGAHQPEEVYFVFGTVFPLMGEQVMLVDGSCNQAIAEATKAGYEPFPILATESTCSDVAVKAIKQRVRCYISDLAHEFAAEIGKEITRITMRDTTSRWGSCSHDGRLNFSWRMAFAPINVLDYLIAHEVSHLAEMNHSPAFWKVVEGLHPNYKQDAKWLKKNGNQLFAYKA